MPHRTLRAALARRDPPPPLTPSRDPDHLARAIEAVRHNDELPLFAAAQARYGPDLVVVVGDAPADSPHRVAERQGAHTVVHTRCFTHADGRAREPLTPGAGLYDELATVLRHEYAHELWHAHLAPAVHGWSWKVPMRSIGRTGRVSIDHPRCTASIVHRGLTPYAGRSYQRKIERELAAGNGFTRATHASALKEAWCELFALVTHRRWPEARERFPAWVHEAAAGMLDLLELPRAAEGGAS